MCIVNSIVNRISNQIFNNMSEDINGEYILLILLEYTSYAEIIFTKFELP